MNPFYSQRNKHDNSKSEIDRLNSDQLGCLFDGDDSTYLTTPAQRTTSNPLDSINVKSATLSIKPISN